ncbi:Rhomboid family [Aspergillus sp. HF37]|nr:Rhomboid family [Aspergillus sp. HF37]
MPDNRPVERGVPLSSQPFSAAEINTIFGHDKLSPETGNRALTILQGRRVDGTLDLHLPASITQFISQQHVDTALEWLRQNHPIDEDAAIIARFEREEREEEAKLIRRAEELGLYKPQSGSYESELGEKGDVSGKSVLKEQRKQNEARNKEREERERREWLEGEAKDQEKLKHHIQKNTALQEFQDAAVTEGKLTLQVI